MQPAEIIHVQTAKVGCDGGGGALGHPLVYLSIGHSGETDCPYCGRHYVLDQDSEHHEHA
ncbi:MAG TPA: zinc-finger domain-containing protein [Alphaproteobacteria bacterium]|nr:zinc-finger domain-containing protein [Alphaproteobacteria bacterium]